MLLNREGFPTHRRSLAEQALQVLMTGNLQDTYYAGRKQITAEAVGVLEAQRREDPVLLARMVVHAREHGYQRLLPTLGLLVLSAEEVFEAAFPRVVRTPRELRDFLVLCRTSSLRRGFGRRIKRSVGRYLLDLSEYQFLKYARSRGPFSLRDALRVARPRPETRRQELILRLLARGTDSVPQEDLQAWLPQVAAWRELVTTSDPARRRRLVEEGRLPFEAVVAAIRPDRLLWRALMRQMPLMALLRHLLTLARRGALATREDVAYVSERLADAEAVRRARILPFRFLAALRALDERWKVVRRYRVATPLPLQGQAADYHLEELRAEIRRSLENALEASLANLLPLEGRVCVATDVSISMSQRLSARGTTRVVDVAALFSAALLHCHSGRALALPFNHAVLPFEDQPGESPLRTVERLTRLCDGGTSLAAPVRWLHDRRLTVDHFIGLTDSEEWSGGGWLPGPSFLAAWRRYRAEVRPTAHAYLLTLAPYRDAPAPSDEPGVTFFYGWSEELVRHLGLAASGGSQLDVVRKEPWP